MQVRQNKLIEQDYTQDAISENGLNKTESNRNYDDEWRPYVLSLILRIFIDD